MARQNLGTRPTRPFDVVDIEWVTSMYPSYSATVVTDQSFTITLPSSPIDHTMYLLEVDATASITVTTPNFVTLTEGVAPVLTVYSGKTAFFGFRYSATADAWFLLSATVQV